MSENQVAIREASIQPKEGANVNVTALRPNEMEQCQSALILWAQNKCREVRSDVKELTEALEHARQRKWKTSTLARHLMKSKKRLDFYSKIKSALEHGFVIVPNFPVTLFAIRTDKTKPLELCSQITSSWAIRAGDKEQTSEALPEGIGDYKNPFPVVTVDNLGANEKEPDKTDYLTHADAWAEMEFPISMSKLNIMEATTNAMALKIFDEFGILPIAANKDPIIVAKIINRVSMYQKREVTFMIAWNLDTRIL